MTSLMTTFQLNFLLPRQARSTCREEGQSLIELALLLPMFLLLLLGSTEFARFAWTAVLTSNAARAGASFGSQNPANAGNTAGIQTAAANDSVNLTGLTTTSSVSCSCSSGASIGSCFTTALTDCPAPATITDYVTVNTTSTVSVFGQSFTANGQSTMVVAP